MEEFQVMDAIGESEIPELDQEPEGNLHMTGVSIRIRVAGGDVKIGGGRYLRDALAKRHSRRSAVLLYSSIIV